MIQLHHGGVTLRGGAPVPAKAASPADREKTMAYQISAATTSLRGTACCT